MSDQSEIQPDETPVVDPVAEALTNTEPNPETDPVFDFSEMSWGDVKSSYSAQRDLDAANTAQDVEGVSRAMTEIERLMSVALVSIPRSWLVKRTPETLDYSDPATLNYLRENRFVSLFNAYLAALGSRNVSKN